MLKLVEKKTKLTRKGREANKDDNTKWSVKQTRSVHDGERSSNSSQWGAIDDYFSNPLKSLRRKSAARQSKVLRVIKKFWFSIQRLRNFLVFSFRRRSEFYIYWGWKIVKLKLRIVGEPDISLPYRFCFHF